MLRWLRIRNFQSIKKADLQFTSGLNVIVGDNGLGKSAIIRALRWVSRDAFRGTHFVKDGTSKCLVSAQVRPGVAVVRRVERTLTDDGKTRRLTANRYTIKTKDGDSVNFDKFKGIPDEVVGALGISQPVELGKSASEIVDLNFADQHRDAIFLMNRPGSLSAKLLLRIIGVEAPMRAMRELATTRRSLLQEEKQLVERADGLGVAINDFPVEALERQFGIMDSKVAAVRDLGQLYLDVERLRDDLRDVVAMGKVAVADRKVLLNAVKLPWDDAEGILIQIGLLTELDLDYNTAVITEQDAAVQSESLGAADKLLDEFLDEWNDVVLLGVEYDELSVMIVEYEDDCNVLGDRLTAVDQEYKDLLEELGVCPTCGQEV